MSKYRDREGNTINIGDVVATRVTINQEIYLPFSFLITIVKKKDGKLVLEGVFTEGLLKDRKPKDLQKLHANIDLNDLNGEWL